MTLQEGVAWRTSSDARRAFSFVALRRTGGAALTQVRDTLTLLWKQYDRLRDGTSTARADLQVLLGYGSRLFRGAPADVATELRECGLGQPSNRSVLPGSSLLYADDIEENLGDADLAVHLTADDVSLLARAVVETDRCVRLSADGASGLRVSGIWSGHARSDRRSWIGFHDGVANLDTRERLNAILVGQQADDLWLRGGTYLAFLRVQVDLDAWFKLDQKERELLVGRDETTGAPLLPGRKKRRRQRLAPGTVDILDPRNTALRDPPPIDIRDPSLIGLSHVQRARRHPNLRLLRRGYEFLETPGEGSGIRTGLNFVSFQSSPMRVATILRAPSWLGEVEFGGAVDQRRPRLLGVRAAGMFAVPAAASTGVPGLDALQLAVWPARE